MLLALAAVWPVYRRFGLPFAVFILITILPPMSAGGMLSMGRVTSILFPVFLWMGAAVPARHRSGVDRAVRVTAGIRGGDVLYVEAVVLRSDV